MSVHETIAIWTDREPSLEEEIGALDDEDMFEMANLSETQTGVPAVIMISTLMGRHGPRVKCFIKPGRAQPSFSVAIASEPRVVAKSDAFDDKTFQRLAPLVIEWVSLNHEALGRFWWSGNDLMDEEVTTFKAGLLKL